MVLSLHVFFICFNLLKLRLAHKSLTLASPIAEGIQSLITQQKKCGNHDWP